MTVLGIRKKSFTGNDGANISGLDLHLMGVDSSVEGNFVDRIFVSEKKLGNYNPQLGDEIDIRYNRFGKIDRVELIEK